jgi:large subunit ribosomal protein L10|tara:strand:+ start:35 stop:541 length:507 start_codon:yes stop_codon:yes gene_type:complete
MQRAEKQDFVKNFNTALKEKEFLIVAHYKGLTVSEISSLRKKVKSSNSIFKVAKNTLAKRAIKDTNFENLDKLFIGPTSVAYSNDPVSTSKAIVDFAKENENLKILGASMSGKELSLNEIKHLASLPSMETLRAKIVGLLSATQRGIVTTLQANQSNLIRVVNNKFKS